MNQFHIMIMAGGGERKSNIDDSGGEQVDIDGWTPYGPTRQKQGPPWAIPQGSQLFLKERSRERKRVYRSFVRKGMSPL